MIKNICKSVFHVRSAVDEVMSMDQSFLKIILENHVLKNKIVLSELYNGQRLETLAGKFLRVFVYRTVSLFFKYL